MRMSEYISNLWKHSPNKITHLRVGRGHTHPPTLMHTHTKALSLSPEVTWREENLRGVSKQTGGLVILPKYEISLETQPQKKAKGGGKPEANPSSKSDNNKKSTAYI